MAYEDIEFALDSRLVSIVIQCWLGISIQREFACVAHLEVGFLACCWSAVPVIRPGP